MNPQAQQLADEAIANIKNSFNKAMTTVANKYKRSKNAVGYQLAQGFLDKVNQYAQQMTVGHQQGGFDPATMSPTMGANTAPTSPQPARPTV